MSKLSDKLKKYATNDPLFGDNTEDAIISRYLRGHQEKRPQEHKKYVGIEVECFGKYTKVELQKLFFHYDLEDYVMIGDDHSIEPPRVSPTSFAQAFGGRPIVQTNPWNTYEIRLLIPQLELKTVLAKFGKLFRIAKLQTNESCGLHVHLDMRGRDLEKCTQKLIKFKDALYAIVEKDRWNNEFCKREGKSRLEADGEYFSGAQDRHVGINLNAFDRHRTIEIRTHHGTIDTTQILKWVNLLLNVVEAKSVPTVKSKKDVLKWPGLKRSLRSYVDKNFKDAWFKEKDSFTY